MSRASVGIYYVECMGHHSSAIFDIKMAKDWILLSWWITLAKTTVSSEFLNYLTQNFTVFTASTKGKSKKKTL